jgi:hypothetical protein
MSRARQTGWDAFGALIDLWGDKDSGKDSYCCQDNQEKCHNEEDLTRARPHNQSPYEDLSLV